MMCSRAFAAPAALVVLVSMAVARPGGAQAPGAAAADASSLAKATQNPVGDLVSVPFQFNYLNGGGLGGQTYYNMNFQPVLPLAIGKRWNLIARTIVPYVDAPTPSNGRSTGVGDIVEQAFFTHAAATDPIWGIGPILSFPTATNPAARSGDWGLGPTAVLVKMAGQFVLGALVSQTWTIASYGIGGDLDQFSVQPFVNYNLADGWAVAFSPTIVANWGADDKWTVPLGLGVSKVTALGKQPMSVGIQYYANVIRPETSGSSQLRLTASFLFPKPPSKGE